MTWTAQDRAAVTKAIVQLFAAKARTASDEQLKSYLAVLGNVPAAEAVRALRDAADEPGQQPLDAASVKARIRVVARQHQDCPRCGRRNYVCGCGAADPPAEALEALRVLFGEDYYRRRGR